MSRWKNLGVSAGLLTILLFVVGVVLAVMGSAVLLPQGHAVLILGGAALVFLAIQLLIFRVLGLRSPADEPPPEDEAPDWRAWRG